MKIKSTFKGSERNRQKIAAQIAERWGEEEVVNYDPYSNVLTFKQWMVHGFAVKRGERALKSTTLIVKTDEKGNEIAKYPRTVNLFYEKQVEKIR